MNNFIVTVINSSSLMIHVNSHSSLGLSVGLVFPNLVNPSQPTFRIRSISTTSPFCNSTSPHIRFRCSFLPGAPSSFLLPLVGRPGWFLGFYHTLLFTGFVSHSSFFFVSYLVPCIRNFHARVTNPFALVALSIVGHDTYGEWGFPRKVGVSQGAISS